MSDSSESKQDKAGDKPTSTNLGSGPDEDVGNTTTDDAERVEKGSSDEQDPNIVFWDGPNDPHNPKNWPDSKKWLNIGVMSVLTVITPLGSSMFAPGIPEIMTEFHSTSSTVATFVLSIYILGFAFGGLIVAPLSEMYGRWPLYNVGNLLFTAFTIGAARSSSMGMLMAFRLLMGLSGAVPVTIGSGSIGDVMPVEKRGRAMATWALGPLLGPCVGPVAGGYLIQAAGWRWVFYLIAILGGICIPIAFFGLQETFAPVLLDRKAARLRKETGNPLLTSKMASEQDFKKKLQADVVRPLKFLTMAPIITAMSLYMAVTYAILYLLITTFTFVYGKEYGFGEGTIGLTFLPAGIGMAIGVVSLGPLSDRLVKSRQGQGKEHRPEIRLIPYFSIPTGLAIPAGLFVYGWTTDKGVHWIVPMIGVAIFSAGLMGVMMCIQNYLIDTYPLYAASVTAALSLFRSLLGALLPLCALQMYDALGLGWGNSLLAFISLALVPIPLVFYYFGANLRKRFHLNV
ncbi:hypothetical protein VTK73DRAFT_4733 [Phialemonium thermophilum]|uniref:Major facilitator superfamily (MFS) profile domain-containing protein n=1 Tax=Phialemonium thermophilum TaxID=223376 RepID=A0ABR3WSA6_9PEZI